MAIIEGENARWCTQCDELKHFDNFRKKKNGKYGLHSWCRDCESKNSQQHYQENKEQYRKWREENKEKLRNQSKKWYEENKEYKLKKNKEYYYNNKEKFKKWKRQWRKNNREHVNEYYSQLREDPQYRAKHNIYSRINDFIDGTGRTKNTKELLGCNWEFFKGWIENQFEDDMNWNNYGLGDGCWNIDHVLPLSFFDNTCEYQKAVCCHYSNLQPMWSGENISKGKKIPNLFNNIELTKKYLVDSKKRNII